MNIQERRNKNGKITSYRIRVFDHTSVSLQLQAGISIADAAKRAGHARPDVTLRIYLNPQSLIDKNAKIALILHC